MSYREVLELPNIQSSFNQALGTSAILTQLSPSVKNRQEEHELKRKSKSLERAANEVGNDANATTEGTTAYEIAKDIDEQRADVAKKQFELNPNKKTYSNYSKLMSSSGDIPIARLPADEDAQVEAMDRMNKQKEAKGKQKRYFKDYLAKMPYTVDIFSGKVGDLSPEAQKQIASNYTKSQRKTIMDRMDREAQNGK